MTVAPGGPMKSTIERERVYNVTQRLSSSSHGALVSI
jgi:hypothetical protein